MREVVKCAENVVNSVTNLVQGFRSPCILYFVPSYLELSMRSALSSSSLSLESSEELSRSFGAFLALAVEATGGSPSSIPLAWEYRRVREILDNGYVLATV